MRIDARLNGRMRADEHVAHAGPDADGNGCGGTGDEAVHHDRNAQRRAAEHEPAHGCEFRPADFGEHVDGITWVGAVDCNAAPDEAGLLADRSDGMPEPMPVTSSTDAPVSTAAIAEEGEVLPMPISPAASRVTPRAASSRAMSMPTCTQANASSRVMAGPSLKSRAAWTTLRRTSPFHVVEVVLHAYVHDGKPRPRHCGKRR